MTGVFNICSGREIAVLDLAAVLRRHVPSSVAAIFELGRPGDVKRSAGSTTRAQETLRFAARISLDAGLGEFEEMPVGA